MVLAVASCQQTIKYHVSVAGAPSAFATTAEIGLTPSGETSNVKRAIAERRAINHSRSLVLLSPLDIIDSPETERSIYTQRAIVKSISPVERSGLSVILKNSLFAL